MIYRIIWWMTRIQTEAGANLVRGRMVVSALIMLMNPMRCASFTRNTGPLLLLNTVNAFVEEDTDYISSFRTGQVWSIPAPADLKVAILEVRRR